MVLVSKKKKNPKILFKYHKYNYMSEKIKKAASNSPPISTSIIEPTLIFLENNVRKPLEKTWFDNWIASPLKEYYIAAKRRD